MATLPLETIRDRTQEMNSTGSLSHPQAAWVGDAVASDDEDSVWVFPECKYNDITSNSSEFVPRRLCPHKNARSKIKTLPFPKTALANNRKPSEDQIRPDQSTNAEKGAFSKTKLGTEEPPTKKQKIAIPVHTFLAKDGSPPFVRTGRSTMNDTKTVPDGVDSYRLERINVRGKFQEVIVLSDSDEYVSEDSDVGNTIGTKLKRRMSRSWTNMQQQILYKRMLMTKMTIFVMYVDLVVVCTCVMVAVTPYISRVWLKTYKRISRL